MTREEPLAVFGYAFPHRKTQDILAELAFFGFRNVTVIAAPWKQLKHVDECAYFQNNIQADSPARPQDVCRAFGFKFFEVDHDNVTAVHQILQIDSPKIGIIGGARILKQSLVELFSEGIVNFHPGKIPETSGLDSFFYTVSMAIEPGVTAHYIDGRVDAGDILFFEPTEVGAEDTPSIVQHNIYITQIKALKRFIFERDSGSLRRLAADRPAKNLPMSRDQKHKTIVHFSEWRAAQIQNQAGRRLFLACVAEDTNAAVGILRRFPNLIDQRNEFGWTPLIVACFHQKKETVRTLLKLGANPNCCGANGTTPLMYAKTAILGSSLFDPDILEILITAGAETCRKDKYGHDIYHYLDQAGDNLVSAWLRNRTEGVK